MKRMAELLAKYDTLNTSLEIVEEFLEKARYALDGIDQRILMLDRKDIVVAGHPQRRAELPPPRLAMAEAERDVVPAA